MINNIHKMACEAYPYRGNYTSHSEQAMHEDFMDMKRSAFEVGANAILPHTIDMRILAHQKFSQGAFPDATAQSTLIHLKTELIELEEAITVGSTDEHIAEEIVDCMFCLATIADRLKIHVWDLNKAMELKVEKNKARTWIKNADNTYSHEK